MEQTIAIEVEHLSKEYVLYKGPRERMLGFFLGKKGKTFYALRDLSFTVEKGECLGLVGMNGSGKSTLSNIIAGLSQPTEGVVTTRGSSSIIAISQGLNQYLSGMENIELKGMMLGMERKKIMEMAEQIIDFADIGEHINQPVKTFSSGMRSRLGFAISINIDPDILIIDEALSVGDAAFAEKCMNAMRSFTQRGKTIVFVSHSTKQISMFCTKTMWLEYGTIREYGMMSEVLPHYEAFLQQFNAMSKEEQKAYKYIRLTERDQRFVAK